MISAIQKVQSRLTTRDKATLDVHMTAADTGTEDDAEAAQLAAMLGGFAASDSPGIAAMVASATSAQARMDAIKEGQDGSLTLEISAGSGAIFRRGSRTKIIGLGDYGISRLRTTPQEWQRAVRALEDADIAVYPVDVGGLLATPRAVSGHASRQSRKWLALCTQRSHECL